MTKRLTLAFVIAVTFAALANTPADARHHKRHHNQIARLAPAVVAECSYDNSGHISCLGGHETRRIAPMGRRLVAPSNGYDMAEGVVGHPSGCPRSAFCGCGSSVRIFGHPVRDLYLAANWFRFAHAIPAPGMVAVRSHHVFVIEQVNGDGTVVAYDANSGGHATRIHTVSLSGYSVRDPHSRQVAMR